MSTVDPLPPDVCFLRVSIAGNAPETIVIKLFHQQCPKTCQNFVALTRNDATTTRQAPEPTYRGCEFHRIIEGFMVQAGDFERFDGTGGYSPIHVGGRFPDESFAIKHDTGIVSMANSGKNSNRSQFFITLKSTPHLDGKHVAFGQVIKGMDTVHKMVNVERVGDRPVPLQRVVITDCGTGDGGNNGDRVGRQVVDGSVKHSRKEKKKKKKKDKKDRKRCGSHSESSDDSNHKRSFKRKRERSNRRKHNGDFDGDHDDDSSTSSRDHKRRRHRRRSRSADDKRENRKRLSRHRNSTSRDDYSSSSGSSTSSSRHRRKKKKKSKNENRK